MNEKMKKALNEALRPGEKILWESGTQRFRITDGREGRGAMLRVGLSTAALLAFAAAYAARHSGGVGFYIVVFAALAIVLGATALQYRQTIGQRYYITSERALTIRPDGGVCSMERANIDDSRLYSLDFGGVALALGSELLEEKDRQLRWRANHPLEGSDYVLRGMVFYRVENAEAAVRLLRAGEEA